jgi:acetylornithine deacetylase/succinyl-diaminopimelate desuccinylase-like protein
MTVEVEDVRGAIDRDDLVNRLVELVRTPSENPPGDELEAAKLVAGYCERIGLAVDMHEVEPGRPNVVARIEGDPGPLLTYCSHVDVVPAGDPTLWDFEPYAADVSDGRLHGRGSADAKGPVAAALEAVAALTRLGWRPAGTLELAFVSDEETMGFKGVGHLVEQGVLRPDVAIVGEPTSLRVVHAQRGGCWFRVIVRGVAAHGSAPERGVNAILHMSEIIRHTYETLPDVSHPVLGGPSINVGTIRGGDKTNVVAASCVAEIDRRIVPGESADSARAGIEDAVARARQRFPDIDARVELAFYAEPFEIQRRRPSWPRCARLVPTCWVNVRKSSDSAECRTRASSRRVAPR